MSRSIEKKANLSPPRPREGTITQKYKNFHTKELTNTKRSLRKSK